MADTVLLLHFAVVLFNVGGWLVVLVGHPRGWRIAHRRGWRVAHLALVWFVTMEALLGYACPLTILEDALREGSNVGRERAGFLQRWISHVMYWDLPIWVFGALYLLFAITVTATFLRWPPSLGLRH